MTNPFVDLGLRVRFRGGSGSVNDGCELIVVPISNLVRLVRFIGHGNNGWACGKTWYIMLERTLGRLL